MKKYILVLLLLSICAFPNAQDLQRVAFPAQRIALPAGKGQTNVKPVKSYCVDFNRYSRFNGSEDYSHVAVDALCVRIGNRAPIPLQQALDEGKIKMNVGNYDHVVFTNLTGEPVVIDIPDHLVLGKSKDDIQGLVIPHKFGEGGQEKVWIIQSLVYLGFLDKANINNETAVLVALHNYLTGPWFEKPVGEVAVEGYVAGFREGTLTPKQWKALSDQLDIHSRMQQFGLASGTITAGQMGTVSAEDLKKLKQIGSYLTDLGGKIPESKEWPGSYFVYKNETGDIYLFDPYLRLLGTSKDERDLAKLLLTGGDLPPNIQLAGGGELNGRQGDALAEAIGLQLKASSKDSYVYYVDLYAVEKNRPQLNAILSNHNQSKLLHLLSADRIVASGAEQNVDADFITVDSKGRRFDTEIEVSAPEKPAVAGFIDWANKVYQRFKPGSLYVRVREYCLTNKLRSTVKSMVPDLRMSRKDIPWNAEPLVAALDKN
jgi:hypothetical protein